MPFPKQNSLTDSNPTAALLTNRIIWAALILGQLCFMMVMAILFSQPPQQPAQPPPDPQLINILVAINAVALVTAIPLFAFIRHTLFKRARVDGILPPQAYATGNIIFCAGCEGVSFFGLVIALLHRSFWPTILIVGAAIAIQVLTFPRAQALARPDDTFKIG